MRRALGGLAASLLLIAASPALADVCGEATSAIIDDLKAGTLSDAAPDLFQPIEEACADAADHRHQYLRLALDLAYLKKLEGAERAAMRLNDLLEGAGRPADWRTAARVSVARQRWAEADERYERAFAFYTERPDAMTADRAYLLEEWSSVHERLGDMDRAATTMREAVAVMSVNSGDRHAAVGQMLGKLADLEARRGDKARAADLYLEAIGIYAATNQERLADNLYQGRATALFALGRLEEAEADARTALENVRDLRLRASRLQTLASIMTAQGRGNEALAMLEAEGVVLTDRAAGTSQQFALLGDMTMAAGMPLAASVFYEWSLDEMDTPPGEASRVVMLYNAGFANLLGGANYSALEHLRQASDEAAIGASSPRLRHDIERRRVWALWDEQAFVD